MADLWDNPMGTDGFEFVEYTAPDVTQLYALFEKMGFRAVASGPLVRSSYRAGLLLERARQRT